MKAQVSSEYMIILAVVLVMALIAAVLLRGTITAGGSVNEQQSRAYWAVASPFSILAQKYAGTQLQLDMQNSLPESVQISQITVQNANYSISQSFTPGERRVVNMTLSAGCSDDGTSYNLGCMWISYQTGSGQQRIQKGELPLVGTCS